MASKDTKNKTRSRWTAGVLLLLAGILAVHYWPRLSAERPRNVILISIDTLRADRLGCYGYESARTPNIDALALAGARFENAATTTPLTLPAHSSIFTGRTPLRHGIIDNFGFRLSETEETLAERLKAHGLATGGFVGSFVLDSRWGIAQGFDTYVDRFDSASESAIPLASHQRPADEVLLPALEWMELQSGRPFFAFVHFFDPHTPYAPPPEFQNAFATDDRGRYDAEIAFVDSQIGRLLAWLEERRLSEETLVVLVSDHGESLGDHGEATHGLFVYDATIHVPLIMRGPGIDPGERIEGQVRTIDVMPTILALMGIEPGPEVEGRSLTPLLGGKRRSLELTAYIESHYAKVHFGWSPLKGLRTQRYKFIDAPARELYDLRADRGETKNLAAEERGAVDGLLAELSRIEQGGGGTTRPEAVGTDPRTERVLRSLGYITSTAKAPDPAKGTRPDPKDKIVIFNKVTEATIRNLTGDSDGAETLLRDVLREDPDVAYAYMMLGNIALQRKNFLEAEEIFRRALAGNEKSVEGTYGLALAYKGLGKLEEAAAGFERALRIDPDQVRATFQLAEVELALGRPAEAERRLRERLAVEPDSSLRLVLADALLTQGRRAAAWAVLREAERDDPSNAMVHFSIGNLLLEENRVAEAIAAYRFARSLDPKDAKIANALGNGLARGGEEAESSRAFETAIELDPGYAPAHNNLGIALARSGRSSEAELAFRRAIELDSGYAEAYNNLGFLYLQSRAPGKAIPFLRRAVALKPEYAQARANLEEALRRAGPGR